jgi:hypothetical protein
MASFVHRIFTRSWGLPVFVINGEGDAWHLAATRWKVSRARARVSSFSPCMKTAANSSDVASRITRFNPPSLAAFPSLDRIARRCVVASFMGRPVSFYGIGLNVPENAFCWDGVWEHARDGTKPHPDQRASTACFRCGSRMRYVGRRRRGVSPKVGGWDNPHPMPTYAENFCAALAAYTRLYAGFDQPTAKPSFLSTGLHNGLAVLFADE